MAIGIKAKRSPEAYDLGASKFFGTPTVPGAWQADFYDDEIFFCQIRLADIAAFDTEGRLPHQGYLYVFLRTGEGDRRLGADVRYHDGEPDVAIDDFNAGVEGYESFNDAYLMEFYHTDADADCTRLFGVPSNWNYEGAPPKLLMQYDPLDHEMGFLDHLDGFLHLFFGENEGDFGAVTLQEEYS